MINVSPLANTPYNSIWAGITDQCLYIPSHLLADPSLTDDIVDSNSTLTDVPVIDYEGTATGVGANSGWFTGLGSGIRAYAATDAALNAFFRTDTLATNESILISIWLYVPAGGATTDNGLFAWGRGAAGQPGYYVNVNAGEKATIQYADATNAAIQAFAATAMVADTINHLFFEIRKTAGGFTLYNYLNGALDQATVDTTVEGIASITGGLSVYARNTNTGGISLPLEADFQMSDLFFARTSGDKTADIAGLAARQSRMRTSLASKWSDVL